MTLFDIEAAPIARVLVIVAHPDDIESWCAGTVCRFTAAGRRVDYVLCTSGDKGTSDPTLTPQQVATIQEAEQQEAARILGVDSITFLRWPDSEVEPTLALRQELVRQIRLHQPDLVITHDPVPPYRMHPDHRAVGRATLDAIFPCARDPLTFAEHIREEGLQARIVPEAWLFATEVPDTWVDISTYCHCNQLIRSPLLALDASLCTVCTACRAIRTWYHDSCIRIGFVTNVCTCGDAWTGDEPVYAHCCRLYPVRSVDNQ